jgi:hypothetical protein
MRNANNQRSSWVFLEEIIRFLLSIVIFLSKTTCKKQFSFQHLAAIITYLRVFHFQ